MRKRKKVQSRVKRLSFVEALRLIQQTHPYVSDWALRKDVINNRIPCFQRETLRRGGWIYFDIKQVQKYMKGLKGYAHRS